MSPVITCPDQDTLHRLMLGQLAGPETDQFVRHLELCDRCAGVARTLRGEDTLVEAARVRVTLLDGPAEQKVRGLVERLRRLGPPTAEPGVESTPTGSLQETQAPAPMPASPAGSEAIPEDQYDFLLPSQGPGELGRLGHYRILKVLGGGGMGVVFLAEDVQLQRQVALKVMQPEAARQAEGQVTLPGAARAAAALEHENVVPI